MPSVSVILSEGDLEVLLLHESHSVLAEIIGPELYSIAGTPPEQTATFHTTSSFNFFLILVVEVFAEGSKCANVHQKYQNWSLLSGLRWFCAKYPNETMASGLQNALSNLESWIEKDVPFKFWCPDLDTEISFTLQNRQLVSFGANTAKHHLFRLADLLGKLESLCIGAGYNFTPQQFAAVLTSMIEEARSRLLYHSTNLLEMLGELFFALNKLIKARSALNPTNIVDNMTMPAGVTSDVFRSFYGSVMVFKQYNDSRIRDHTPVTTRFLKMRY